MALDHIWWVHNLNSDIEPRPAHWLTALITLNREYQFGNPWPELINVSTWIVQPMLLIGTVTLITIMSSWVICLDHSIFNREFYIFCADMSRLKVITFEQSKHYVLYVIGFYMNYTDWVGVGDMGAQCRRPINNSVWSHNEYDTSQKFYCRWYLHSSSVVFHDLCLLGNTIFA